MQVSQFSSFISHFMKRILFRLFSFILALSLILGCSNNNTKLKIATAANMQFAMEELIQSFEAEKGIEADMILSSSGKLTAQIQAGAPFDLFFSADTKFPEQLASRGLSESPEVYAYGQLVYWVKTGSENQLFAMANPKTAPYGKAAEEYLTAINRELPDVVFGESISQVNQFLLSGTVDAGYTSLSSVLSEKFKGEGDWTLVPDTLHSPIEQSMVILNDSEHRDDAIQFAEFIKSSKGKEILKRYGYK